jgi:hypothetical protein
MAKKARSLDTPFRPGERVVMAGTLDDITSGTTGKVQVANGLGNWRRYWVRFDGGRIRGQVPHAILARPDQLALWEQAQEAKARAALDNAQVAAAVEAGPADGDGGAAAGGAASRIPAGLLERSKAAKARLLG